MKWRIWVMPLVILAIFSFVLDTEATAQQPDLKPPYSVLGLLKNYIPSLPREIRKLPDYQGSIQGNRLVALNRLYSIIRNATPDQVKNLDRHLNIGIPGKRSYCTPLQAILWVLEKEDDISILDYTLTQLLDKAWDFSELKRWQNYDAVTTRLNAPELVNYYQRIKLVYKSKKGKRNACVGNPRRLFSTNFGNCYDYSKFAVYCLKKAGYKASVVGVHPLNPKYHVVCQYEVDGKKYYIDNGRPDKFLRRGIIPKEEYEMYQEKENVRKGQRAKDPVYLLQDNYGLALVYLTDQGGRVISIKTMCKDLGISGYEEKVRNECLPALVDSGFITKLIPHGRGSSGSFEYALNSSLCERFKEVRYHRPQNAAQRW